MPNPSRAGKRPLRGGSQWPPRSARSTGVRPAVATVRIRQNGEERTIAVCEEHLRELQGQSRGAARSPFGGRSSLFDEFFSDFFGDSASAAARPATRRHDDHEAAPPGRADRRHAVLQRRHPPTAPACRAEGDGVGEPGRRLDTPALGRDAGRGRPARAAAGRRRCRRDRGADRGGSRHPGAHGRGAVAVAGREGRPVGRLRGVASDRRVVRRPRARAARAGAGHRDRGGRAARAVRDHAHEAARRGHPRRRERRGGWPPGEHDKDARRVRPRPHGGGPPGEARSRDRPGRSDRADDRDPLAPHEEQPGAARRPRRRQDRDRRGHRAADRQRRRARDAHRQAPGGARHGGDDRRHEVPGRVRGTPEGRDRRDHRERGQPDRLHRRDPHRRRRGSGRGRDGRRQHAQAGARARRAAHDRRDHARRVPEEHREGSRARAAFPARAGLGADGRGDDRDPHRPQGPL